MLCSVTGVTQGGDLEASSASVLLHSSKIPNLSEDQSPLHKMAPAAPSFKHLLW